MTSALSRRRFLQVATGVTAGLLLPGCTSPDSAAGLTVRSAGSAFGFPSPFAYIAGPGYVQMSLIYDTLLWKDASGELLPWLASDHQRSDDGLTHRFSLRPDVTWHDGKPLTAEDVAFTFEYFAALSLGPLLVAQAFGVSGARALDELSVAVDLELPAVTFPEQVAAALPIIPKHVWSAIDDAPRAQDLDVLVGSGPYRLTSFSRGEGSLAYTANADHFLGAPFVDRIELVPVDDELTALQAGSIDVADAAVEGSRPQVIDDFRDDPSYGIVEEVGGFTFPLIFNLGRGGALADVRFRRACALAIDRSEIVDRLLGGRGLPGNPGFLPLEHPFHVPVEQYAHDVGAANLLLDTAGYPRRSSSELRRGPDGRPLRFELLTGNSPVPAVLPLLVDSLAQIGVGVEPVSVDLPTLFGRLQDGDNDLALSLYPGPGGTAPSADPDTLRTFYSSRIRGRLQGAQGWVDEDFDRLADEQLVTFDRNERALLLAEMQQIVARDLPALPLYYPTLATVFRTEVLDRWYYTPGGFGGGLPNVRNKQVLVTGQQRGLQVRGSGAG